MGISRQHKEQIDNVDVVSFDIFDTLLTRKTAHPQDVFIVARELFNERSGFYLEGNFAQMRLNAEEHARRTVNYIKTDITIDDIYESFGILYGYNDRFCTLLMEYEVLAEDTMLSRDMSTYDLYDYACMSEKKIIIVSDMYLRKKHIVKMLKDHGVTRWDELIISSEDNVAKFSGSAFARILQRYPNKNILHVGDNLISDISWAQKYNIDTIHVHRNIEEMSFEREDHYRVTYSGDRFRKTLGKFDLNVHDVQTDIISGLIAVESFNNPNKTLAYMFGYGFFGPLLLAYTQWTQRIIVENKYDHIYFLARDGAIMQKAYNAYYGVNAQENTYLLASRRVMNFPELHRENFDIDGIAGIVGSKELDIRKTLQYYGIDPESKVVIEVLSRVGLSDARSVSHGETADRFKAALIMLSEDIKRISHTESDEILKYLEYMGVLKAKKPLLCDIGWNGSMQQSINMITQKDIDAIYFGLYKSKKSLRIGDKAYGFFDARTEEGAEIHYEKLFQVRYSNIRITVYEP